MTCDNAQKPPLSCDFGYSWLHRVVRWCAMSRGLAAAWAARTQPIHVDAPQWIGATWSKGTSPTIHFAIASARATESAAARRTQPWGTFFVAMFTAGSACALTGLNES